MIPTLPYTRLTLRHEACVYCIELSILFVVPYAVAGQVQHPEVLQRRQASYFPNRVGVQVQHIQLAQGLQIGYLPIPSSVGNIQR